MQAKLHGIRSHFRNKKNKRILTTLRNKSFYYQEQKTGDILKIVTASEAKQSHGIPILQKHIDALKKILPRTFIKLFCQIVRYQR